MLNMKEELEELIEINNTRDEKIYSPELKRNKDENIYANELVRKVEIQKAVEREKRRLKELTKLIKRRDKVRGLSLRNRQYIIFAEQYCEDHTTSRSPLIPKMIANNLKRIVIRQLCKQYRNIWKESLFMYFLRIGTHHTLYIEFKVYKAMGLFSSWFVRAKYEVDINSDQIEIIGVSPI